ncbi:MAG: hypothetical protein IT279_11325 [Ignavibacteriaceae bacterium]|jgi:hypothetical protein|nr:hypothetical protein [Ignavibacteriaceae bacterium]
MKSVLCFLLLHSLALANIAMPGFWQTGTGRTFVHFFKEDAAHSGKVLMMEEEITIALYKNFAAVKGVYIMHNSSPDTITIRTGFPVSGSANSGLDRSILFEDLHALTVSVNGTATDALKLEEYINKYAPETLPQTLPADSVYSNVYSQHDNWYVWESSFPPGQSVVTVYYLTDNSFGRIREGYNNQKANLFSYILETGKTWGGTIGKGTVTLYLMDGLTEDDIEGITPAAEFAWNGKNILQRRFENLNPSPGDNLLIRYTPSEAGFDINNLDVSPAVYFTAVDSLASLKTVVNAGTTLPEGDFEPDSEILGFGLKILGYLAGGVFLFYGIKYLVKKKE